MRGCCSQIGSFKDRFLRNDGCNGLGCIRAWRKRACHGWRRTLGWAKTARRAAAKHEDGEDKREAQDRQEDQLGYGNVLGMFSVH